jgi:hypothetical protein
VVGHRRPMRRLNPGHGCAADGKVTATTATVDSHRPTSPAVLLGTDTAGSVVVTPEKRKVGGSTPPPAHLSEQSKRPASVSGDGA